MVEIILELRFGSHLYGTDTPQSDIDYKAVYIPAARDILLQRVRSAISRPSDKVPGEKNAPGAIDHDMHSLQRYLELLAEGQTMALDMLFAPDSAMTRSPAPLWREIQANAPRLVTRRASACIRYCRQQANKYGIKGSRVATAREALALLSTAESAHGAMMKLAAAEAEVTEFAKAHQHASLIDLPMPSGQLVRHLDVCGRKMPFSSTVKFAREIVQRMVEEYGQRAIQAERAEGVDWKALSHAVRVGRETLELLATGRITLPLPYAAEILAIKRGEAAYAQVAETVDQLLVEVEAAALTSPLREAPDRDFIDDLVAEAYRAKVLEAS